MEHNIKMTILDEAKESIENEDIRKAEVLLKGYLDFNNDPEVSSILANIYTGRGELNEALEILKGQDSNYFCVFKSLAEVYIKLQKYDKLYNLWNKNRNRNFQDVITRTQILDAKYFLRRLQIFLKTFVRKKIETPSDLNYKEEQYLHYDYKKTIEHIQERHTSPNNRLSIKLGSIFFNYYDLEELLFSASRNIEFEKRMITLDYTFSDTYMFKFKNIGIDKYSRKRTNCFCVAAIPNTNKIITMYPVTNRKTDNCCTISRQDKLPICNPNVHSDRVYRAKTYSISKKQLH